MLRPMTQPPTAEQLRAATDALLPDVVSLRRLLHRWPEIGLELPRTQDAVVTALKGLPVDIARGAKTSSVVATLEGSAPGPTILLRADMDALPQQEATGLAFASERDGIMHSCGHDAHTAMLVGAARLLAAYRSCLAGRVRFVFQPGEEGHNGARLMLDEGLLDDQPLAAFALHSLPTSLSGHVGGLPGSFLASSDSLRITVHGRGGHACAPDQSVDPIPVACEAVLALQSFAARRLNPAEPAVLSITRVQAGVAEGVIPDTVTMEGTVRAHSRSARRAVLAAVERIIHHVAAAHQATAEVVVEEGNPPLVNDTDVTAQVFEVARDVLGQQFVHLWDRPVMSSDDFAFVLERVPGAMVALGTRVPGAEKAAPNHSPEMVLDEAALAAGVALHAGVALRFLSDPDWSRSTA